METTDGGGGEPVRADGTVFGGYAPGAEDGEAGAWLPGSAEDAPRRVFEVNDRVRAFDGARWCPGRVTRLGKPLSDGERIVQVLPDDGDVALHVRTGNPVALVPLVPLVDEAAGPVPPEEMTDLLSALRRSVEAAGGARDVQPGDDPSRVTSLAELAERLTARLGELRASRVGSARRSPRVAGQIAEVEHTLLLIGGRL
jgi:hypothetical protein